MNVFILILKIINLYVRRIHNIKRKKKYKNMFGF